MAMPVLFIQKTLNQFPDQWMFLETVQKVKTKTLDELYEDIIVTKITNPPNGTLLQIL